MNTNEKDLSFTIARGPGREQLLEAFSQQGLGEERSSVLLQLCRGDNDGDVRRNLVVKFQPVSLTHEGDSGDKFALSGFITLMPIDLFSELSGPLSVIYAHGDFDTKSSQGHLTPMGDHAADFHYVVNEIFNYFDARRTAEIQKSNLNEVFRRFGLFD